MEVLPKLVWHFDEPFSDSSAIPTWYVSQLTRQHVTVSLTGDGGDELFAGYPRYRAVAMGDRLDRIVPLRRLLAARWWQSIPSSARQKSRIRQFKRFSESLGLAPVSVIWIGSPFLGRLGALYFIRTHSWQSLEDEDPFDFLQATLKRIANRDPVTAISLMDLQTYLPCDLMTKVDIASMAHALECRQPFLDHRVMELAASFPIEWKFQRGKGKRILKRAFGQLLPPEIWSRKKMGFGVPLDHWFRHELKEMTHDLLLSETARQRGWFCGDYVAKLIRQHERSEFDHAYRLWALLILECWMRQWHDSPI